MQAAVGTAIGGSEISRAALDTRHTDARGPIRLLLVFTTYLLAGEIGLATPFTSGNVSPYWPPAGVALAAMLISGYRIWPAVAAGAFVVNYFSGMPLAPAFGVAVGNTVGPWCGAWLLRRRTGFDSSLPRLRDVLSLTILGAAGTAVSATIGASVLFLADIEAWTGVGASWLVWWVGDSMGMLIVAPVLLTAHDLVTSFTRRRGLELTLLLLGALASALMIFDPRISVVRAEAFGFVVFPFVLWGALRFKTAGATVVSFLICSIAVWGTAHGFGPFLKGTSLQNAILLDSFLGVTVLSGLLLAAAVAERAQLIGEQRARDAIARSARSYRDIVETAYEGIWKIDAQCVTSFVNTRMTQLLGYTADEMIGRPLFDFMFESDIEKKRADLQRRRRGVSEQIESRYRKKDGSVLWARVATSPVLGEDGSFQGALAMISDITEQKRAEAEASRSREMINLLSRAVEQTADSVVITDREGRIQYVNPAFESTTGYMREEAVGNTPRILKSYLHDHEFYATLWGQILQGQAFRGTLVNRKKSGELFRTEQTITPIKDAAGAITHFVSVLKDVTEIHRQRERALQLRLAREVQQKFYASTPVCLDRFDIATVAHPAEETGGDYLDLITVGDRRICIGIGDVSGHGLDSALVMALTRAYVRSFAHVESDLATVLSSVNRMLVEDLDENRFVTLLLVCLDGESGSMTYSSAGHIPGFVMNAAGEVGRVLESSGPPLGLFQDARYLTSTVTLGAQDLVVLLTDGVTESTTAEDAQFGTEGVLEYVRSHMDDSARELAAGIFHAARNLAPEAAQQDDMTEVIVKVH